VRALFVGMLALALACGDSSGPGKRAASVTGVAGDNQSAPSGAQLAFPLTFTALGSDGLPIEGVPVQWTVTPAGRASFTPPSTTTAANGVASTAVTLGFTPGPITLQAAVTGVTAPVVYHATILDPCAFTVAYTLGQTVNANLAATDCNLGGGGWFYDFYELVLPAGQHSFRVSMRSTAFDTWVDFFKASGQLVGFDDDSILGIAQNSQLDIILPGDTTYIIGANSFQPGATGPYTITTTVQPAGMNGCRQVFVARGITASDSITAGDCADSGVTPHHYDVARIVVYGGSVLTLRQASTTMNPALKLYLFNPSAPLASSRTLVASNDDSLAGTSTNAFIQYAVAAADTDFYDIIIGTSAAGETGTYTFEVSASSTFSPPASGPVSRLRDRRAWWRDFGLPKRSKL
jgi:hypothetical protein